MNRAKYFIVPLLLAFGFTACEEERKKSNDDDDAGANDDDGAGGTSTNTTNTTTGGSGDCSAVCANAASAGCAGFDPNLCNQDCQSFYESTPSQCLGALDGVISCWSSATPVCDGEGVSFLGCDGQIETYGACVNNPTTTTGGAGGGGTGTGWCYDGAGCNPMGPLCGASGSACDVGDGGLTCYPEGNTQGLGQSCGETGYCQHGLTCYDGICFAYCCDNADCGTGTCQSVGAAGTTDVRVCL